DSIMPIVEHVKPEHFADPLHSRIWEICLDVSHAGRKISYVVMKPLLGDALTKVGDDYLAKLCDHCGPVQRAPQMASTIINAWQVRAIAE
ncbi:DnaB-like helicase N-terminal domain-containing protein, partial [Mycobacterium tuberculosis]